MTSTPTDVKLLDLTSLSNQIPQELLTSIHTSIQIIRTSFQRYSFRELAFSFNGGKDCTVLLHLLYLACLKDQVSSDVEVDSSTKSLSSSEYPSLISSQNSLITPPTSPSSSVTSHSLLINKMRTIYFDLPNSFDESLKFTRESCIRYGLVLEEITCEKIKEGLSKISPEVRAIYIGTRSTDPYCEHLTPFTPTDVDQGWPALMRINPILHWTYEQIWQFLHLFKLPYCVLYDSGYTSIGSTHNTIPHPDLQENNGTFSPASKLKDGKTERKGR